MNTFGIKNDNYSRLKLSNLACKSASASDGVTALEFAPPLVPPFPPAPIAAACGCLLPAATDNEPDACKTNKFLSFAFNSKFKTFPLNKPLVIRTIDRPIEVPIHQEFAIQWHRTPLHLLHLPSHHQYVR